MSVREQSHVAINCACPSDHPVRARAHLRRRLPAWAAIAKDQPARRALVNLARRQSLVLAVVPLGEVMVYYRFVAEPSQLAGFARPLHRATEDESERLLGELRPHSFGEPAPVVGQRNIGRSSVLPAEAPRRLAVSDREDIHVRLLSGQTLSAS